MMGGVWYPFSVHVQNSIFKKKFEVFNVAYKGPVRVAQAAIMACALANFSSRTSELVHDLRREYRHRVPHSFRILIVTLVTVLCFRSLPSYCKAELSDQNGICERE
jgi:hypothetical protein